VLAASTASDDDYAVPHRRIDIAAQTSHGEVRDVPEASHLIQFDKPDAVSDAVIDRVKRLR